MILETAFEMVRKDGIDTINARTIAKMLRCSTQPIFSHFSTMEELRQETFQFACKHWINEIMNYRSQPDFMVQVTLWVLNLARTEPHSFHFLYLSNRYQKKNLFDFMMDFESNKEMMEHLMGHYQLDKEACKNIFLTGFLLLHGIATMIATNHMDFTDEQALMMMKNTVSAMVTAEKGQTK